MSLSDDEATPCGDGTVKGVKVARPGSGGQEKNFHIERFRTRSIRTAVAQRVHYTYTIMVVGSHARSRVHLMTRRRSLDASPDAPTASRMILARPRRFIFGSLTRRLVADQVEASCFHPAAAAAVATAAVTAAAATAAAATATATATSGMLAAACDIIICLLRRSGRPRSIIHDL